MKWTCVKCRTDIEENFGEFLSPLCKSCSDKLPKIDKQSNISFEQNGNKRCPSCAENILMEAIKCKHCGYDFTKTNDNTKRNIIVASIVFSIFLFLGFFHVVTDALVIIPKSNFTYSLTFVSVSKTVKQYNNQTLGDRIRGDALFNNLVKELKKRGLLIIDKKTQPLKNIF